MKNFLKFLIFVVLVSLGISLLYDYRMKHGGLSRAHSTPEKYSLATAPPVDRKEIGTLEQFNRERRTLGFKYPPFGRQREDIEKNCGAPTIRPRPIRIFFPQPTPVPQSE